MAKVTYTGDELHSARKRWRYVGAKWMKEQAVKIIQENMTDEDAAWLDSLLQDKLEEI